LVLLVGGALLIVLPLGLRAFSTGTGAQPIGNAPPLSPTELLVVEHSRAAVGVIVQALPLVPQAMIDGAATADPKATPLTTDQVSALLSKPDLVVLHSAILNPAPVASPLSRALSAAGSSAHPFRFPSVPLLLAVFAFPGIVAIGAGVAILLRSAPQRRRRLLAPAVCLGAALWLVGATFVPVTGGASIWSTSMRGRDVSAQLSVRLAPGQPAVSSPEATTALQAALNLLQGIYTDIVPAIQAAATSVGGQLSAAAAAAVLTTDPRLLPVRELLTSLSTIYGAGILSLQAIAAAQSGARSRQASIVLPVVGLLLAVVLALAALWVWVATPLRRQPTMDWEPTQVPPDRLGVRWQP
jgi:hypothetical protein